jgi:uncharacterized protein (DUF2141 family)
MMFFPTDPPALRQRSAFAALFLSLLVGAASPSHAAELVVRVKGIAAPLGQIGCSLFASDKGFPMDNSGARQQWLPAQAGGTECRFSDVAPGSYAVSIGHDRNGNRKVDTNFVGLPTEQWGVSRNARPSLRAPRFNEAVFTVPADAAMHEIEITVAQ